jgi:hypothetical protein
MSDGQLGSLSVINLYRNTRRTWWPKYYVF